MSSAAIGEVIQQYLAGKLGVAPEAIVPSERFRRLGVDSLTATSMLAMLGKHLGRSLSPTLAWQFPTPSDLARHLAGEDVDVPEATADARPTTSDEPIAIVGLACRFPGAADPDAFWTLLRDGVDAIREVPKDRWDLEALFDADPAAPGKMSTRWAGLLDDVASFDAGFFGISPREAAQIDPQQRLMLELSWEAIEDSGLVATALKGTRTGVFFGTMWTDYSHLPGATADRIGPHTATGQDLSIVPARVSYTLGLVGPSMAVNTACSSSLVAVHLARQSLLRGESRLALAGGVNLLISPDSTIAMSKFGAMAPDGRSKAFDASANGYVRAEGAGVVMLKRLSDAIADGDRVYCTIRGSALNNDGFSNGLTAPSPQAQEAVIRDACADAGVSPSDVQYVEAHGTGTMLGDPIEAGALGAALGRGRPVDRPLRIGSVKTNVGHLEAAAGMAGLIKVVLAMRERQLPRTLHYRRPNPHIDFERLRLRVQDTLEPWSAENGKRLAGVSSFGFGGTNAHVVLESREDAPLRSVRLAASDGGQLVADAGSLAAALRGSASALGTIAEPTDIGRKPHRLAVVARSADDLASQLEAFALGRPPPGLVHGTAPDARPRVVLVFGGQGSQWLGMGRALLREDAAGRAALTRCDAAMRPFAEWSLLERLQQDNASLLDDTAFVQPAIFAMQIALAEALRARGLAVDAVVGQSMGEVAAAHVAGALSLEDAARVICVRSSLVGQVRGGRMAVVGLSLDAATTAIEKYGNRLSIAVAAGPESTVVAGEQEAVEALRGELEPRGTLVREIRVDYASHSRYMDPLLPELRARLADVRPRACAASFWSTVTGGALDGRSLDAAYWARNLRDPVLFAPTLRRLASEGPAVFVEVDPHPVLAQFVEQCLASAGSPASVVPCAARDEAETQTLAEAAGRLFVLGADVRAEAAPSPARAAELLVLSAKTPEALSGAAARLREHLDGHPDVDLGDVAYSLLATRSSLSRRLALVVSSREALRDALEGAAWGEALQEPPDISNEAPPKVVFVFPGQGSQWLGMGRQLLAEEPAFREALTLCDRAIAAEAGWSVLEELEASVEGSKLDRIDVVQPLLFAMEVALAALWRAWGVEPHAVVGHSMGEVAAACVAGAISLEDGVSVICRRSALLKRVSGQGEMALVELSIDEANAELKGFEDRLGVAVSNGRRSTVLSGDPSALALVLERLEKREIFCRRVKVDVASHSPQMDPLLGDLVAKLQGLEPRAARVPIRSTVTGAVLRGPELTATYWADNLRQPVRFGQAVEALLSDGFTLFVEMSPHPTLVSAIQEIRTATRAVGIAVGSLRREQPERTAMLESLGALHVHGQPLDPKLLFPNTSRRVSLPTYAWQRERHWLAPAAPDRSGGKATGHPLLGARVPVAGADAVYEAVLSADQPPYLSDHRVGDRVLVPGAALAEIVRAAADDYAGGRAPPVAGLVLQTPLVLAEHEAHRVQVVITEAGTRAALYGQAARAAAGAPWVLHVTADVDRSSSETVTPAALDVGAVRARCSERVQAASIYAELSSVGIHHGPAFQGLRALWRGPREALAEVELAEGLDADGYGLHPALLDAALQAAFGALDGGVVGTFLPFELGRLVLHSPGATAALVHVRLEAQSAEGFTADIRLVEPSGKIIAQVDGFTARRADARALALEPRVSEAVLDAFYRLEWPVVEAPASAPASLGRWAVVSNGDPPGESRLAKELRDLGARCEAVEIPQLEQATGLDHVVCVWNAEGAADEAMRTAAAGLAVVQALLKGKTGARLWWVTTRGTSVAASDRVALPPSVAWGLGRTVMQEHPELGCTLVDVEEKGQIADALSRELKTADGENQIALRGGRRHAARLVRAPATPNTLVSGNYRLETKGAGTLDGLGPVAAGRVAPAQGEVEIDVRASGINFRDVLSALGMYPGAPIALGSECAGVVVRIGGGVEGLRVGDRVMVLAAGTFSRFVTVDSRWVAPAPAGLTFEQAATVPAVFLTAWYALHDLAGLKRGERLLVHAAAGGVGMAAVQLARWIGAEVLATASLPKWETVRAMGVRHVANSRDPKFSEVLRAAAGGADVVLNSLAGEFVDASLSLLSPGGRFIEMGKTDIRDPAKVAAAHPGVVYRAFDLFEVGPDKIAAMFRSIGEGFATGHLKALPVRTFAMSEAEEAFRLMAQGRHTGKLALQPIREALRTDGTVLITGGLGALGLEVARDMADRGVPHLVLLGRRGLDTPGARDEVAALEGRGVRVTVAAADAANRGALEKVIGAIPTELPLRAVVHAAGLIDDGLLAKQTPERFRSVMSPKVQGAWNLHTLTANADLDAFVLFSSIAGTLGNGGQGAYAAGNAFLDALAAERRASGLAGASLAWGPWAERGLAAGLDARQREQVAQRGFGALSPSEGRSLFAAALARPEALLVIAALDLRAVAKGFGSTVPPVWRALIRASSPRTSALNGAASRDLAAMPAEQRADAMGNAVRAEIARVLSLGRASAVPFDRPLQELGLDSLMAVELRNALGRRVGRALPATLAFDYRTAAAITKYLLGEAPSVKSDPGEASSTVGVAIVAATPAITVDPSRSPARRSDRVERIPMGERWFVDAFRVIPSSGGFAQRAVDVSRAMETVEILNAAGLRATLVHVIIRAAALALARNPQLHQLVCGYRRLTPGAVDIGLSMAGQTSYAPVVVLSAVDRQPLGELVSSIEPAIAAARAKERVDLDNLRRVGWMTPIGWLRRLSIRLMQKMFWYRRKLVGTFQVTSVPTADAAVPLQFYSGSILSFGRPSDSVVVVDGRPAVRPMMMLTVCADHAVMDELRAAALLSEIIAVLESDELPNEARATAPAAGTPRLGGPSSGIRLLPAEVTSPAASGE